MSLSKVPKSTKDKVFALMNDLPRVKSNYKLLLLSYWKVFDGIPIPDDVIVSILEHGTEPETINRSRRFNANILIRSEDFAKEIQEFIEAMQARK